MRAIERRVVVTVRAQQREWLQMDIFGALRELKLELQHANISTFEPFTLTVISTLVNAAFTPSPSRGRGRT